MGARVRGWPQANDMRRKRNRTIILVLGYVGQLCPYHGIHTMQIAYQFYRYRGNAYLWRRLGRSKVGFPPARTSASYFAMAAEISGIAVAAPAAFTQPMRKSSSPGENR